MTASSSSSSSHSQEDSDESETVRIGYDDNGVGRCEASVSDVLGRIQWAGRPSPTHPIVVLYLYLGCDHRRQLFQAGGDSPVPRALEDMVATTYRDQGRRWKRIVLEFSTPPGTAVAYDSRDQSRWFKLESGAKEGTNKFAGRLQRKMGLDETEIRVDGTVHSNIQPNGDFVNHGVATISFPKVRWCCWTVLDVSH